MRQLLPAALLALEAGGCVVPIGEVQSQADSGGAKGGTAGMGGAAGTAAGKAGAAGAGGGGDAGAPIFFDDFSTGLSHWQQAGDGSWTAAGGEAQQTSPTASSTFMYVPVVNQANYRVSARMRQLGTDNAPGGALEIAFRIEPAKPSLYHCNWQPNDGRIVLMYLDGVDQGYFAEKLVPLPGNHDVNAWFTLEITVVAAQIQCRVVELPGSDLAATASPWFASGHVGLKTWRMAGSFDSFEVYSP
jgi:hypothetical protein